MSGNGRPIVVLEDRLQCVSRSIDHRRFVEALRSFVGRRANQRSQSLAEDSLFVEFERKAKWV